MDDKAGKPEGIHFMIGRRPVAAFGNSIGDKQMLQYTHALVSGLPPSTTGIPPATNVINGPHHEVRA